ncbi:Pre-mRNA cleavage complex 2 protein Pcf11, partial [Stegodyphus mimosarum]
MYLVDSIIKNIGGLYIPLFCNHLIVLFSSVFEKVEESTRSLLYKLRQTWNDILPNNILYGVDCRVNALDPAWPITAAAPAKNSIHLNPKFLGSSVVQKNVLLEAEAEMKKKLNLLQETKKELSKTLAMKKLEVATKQKKTAVVLPQESENVISHRDPRLKKTIGTPREVTTIAANKLNSASSTLQSVVVVPNTKIPSHNLTNVDNSLSGSENLIPKVKPVQNVINSGISKGSHLSLGDKNDETSITGHSEKVQDIAINKHLNEANKDINRDSEILNKDHPSKRFKSSKYNSDINRKRHLSPVNDLTSGRSSPKVICKQHSSATLRTYNNKRQNSLEKENSTEMKSNIKHSVVDKGFQPVNSLAVDHLLKNESNPEGKKSYYSDSSMLQHPVLGSKDKDYRLLRNDRDYKLNQLHSQAGHPSKIGNDGFSLSQGSDVKNQPFEYR